MDRNSIIILVACMLALLLWFPMVNKLYPPKPLPPGATNALASARAAAGTNLTATSTNLPAPPPTLTSAPKPVIPANAPEETVVVTNEDVRYTFTSHGGGLKEVGLVDYPETISVRRGGGLS